MIGPRRSAPPVNMPDNFVAPYDAFEPRFKDKNHVLLVIIGVEIRHSTVHPVVKQIADLFTHGDKRPTLLEHGIVRTDFGPPSHVWFTYWSEPEHYQNWAKASGYNKLLNDRCWLSGTVGLWREECLLSLDHNETSYSRDKDLTGLANMSDAIEVTPVHAYWGSARDRMVAAADDHLIAHSNYEDIEHHCSLGKRLHIVAPANVCMIKTTQDYSQLTPEQKVFFEKRVAPAYHTGLQYLRDNGPQSGCIGMRFIDEANATGLTGKRTLGLGFFTSLGELENWTHHHPTHVEIMTAFGEMVEMFQGQPGLHLWHEITVFPANTLRGEYINCSADGTLLKVTKHG